MTYYEILEVNENASKEVIHMAYKALCKKYHPDIFSGDKNFSEEQMKKINAAYDVLSDDVKRKEYDEYLKGQKNNKQDNEQIDISKKTSKFNVTPKKKIIILLMLIAVLLAAIIVGILFVNSIYQNKLDKDKTNDTKYSNDNTNANDYIYNDNVKSFAEWSAENKEKSDFLDEHIVFVIDGFDNYYYTYDEMLHVTKQIDEYEFWAYNKEAAISLDYVASSIDVSNGWSKEKADFLDENIVFIIDGFGNYYYTYDEMVSLTQNLVDYEFWAYNTELAISKGYKHCSDKFSNNTNSNDSDLQAFEEWLENDNENQYIQSTNEFNNPQDYDYNYQDTCLAAGCDNIPNNHNFYCSEHACAESNCLREKNYGYSSVYCSYHECNEVGCENRKKDYGSYCSEHKCANPYCTSQKFSIYDYCIIHYDE